MIQTTGGNVLTNIVSRSGYGDFPLNTVDWTIFVRFKYNGAIAAGQYASILNLFAGTATDFTDPYFFIGSGIHSDDINIEMFNGTTDLTSTTQAIVSNTQNWAAATYNSTTHVTTMIVNGSTIGTITLNMSSVVFNKLVMLGDGTGAFKSPISVAYCRAWSRILMAAELTTESTSIIAASQTGLIWDNPLQAGIDLTSHNNTLNFLTATGTVTTDTTDPLVSVVAGPPTNISPATATVVTTDSVYFQDVNTTGVATNVWVVCTAQSDTLVMGAISFGDLTTYKPAIHVYAGLANANANNQLLNGVNNLPSQFPVSIGTDYYFECVRNGAVAASTLQVSILKALNLPVPQGSFAVIDDTFLDSGNFPMALLDRITGYPINFTLSVLPGEGGTCLPSGIAASTDDDISPPGHNLTIFDNGITISQIVDITNNYSRLTNDQSHTFYAGFALVSGQAKVISISDTGIIGSTSWLLPDASLYCLGVNKENTILYYTVTNAAAVAIKRFDLVNNVALTNLANNPATYHPGKDILVWTDDTIMVPGLKPGSFIVTQFNTNGTVAQTYTISANVSGSAQDNRIAIAVESGFFWAWNRLNSPLGFDQFIRVRVSDGAQVETTISGTCVEYEAGGYVPAASNTPVRFGHSESCPFWVVLTATTPANPGGGIYLLTGTSTPNPRQNHDTIWVDSGAGTTQNLAIPNPTFETYLAGDE